MSTVVVTETARVERLVQGDHEYDRRWETLVAIQANRREDPNRTLSAWLHDRRPATGTYRLMASWGGRSDEITYRSRVA